MVPSSVRSLVTLHRIQSPLLSQQKHKKKSAVLHSPVGLNERSRELTIDSQTIPGHAIWRNGLIGEVEIISPGYASVGHSRAETISHRSTRRARGVDSRTIVRHGRIRRHISRASHARRDRGIRENTAVRWRSWAACRAGWVRRIRVDWVTTWKAVRWKRRVVNQSPMRVSALLGTRKRGDEMIDAIWNPSRCLVGVFGRTSIRVRSRWLWRRVDFAVFRCSWPFEWKGHIVVLVVVQPTVPVGVGGRPSSGVLSDGDSRRRTAFRGVVEFRRSGSGVDRRNRCRSGKVMTVGDHGVLRNEGQHNRVRTRPVSDREKERMTGLKSNWPSSKCQGRWHI